MHDEVAHDHAHPAAHERIRAAAVSARLHVAARAADGGRPLEAHLEEEEHEGARDVEPVGEEGAVVGVGLLLGLEPADGEDVAVGLAGEQVAAARAAVPQQALPAAVAALDLGAVRRGGAGHQDPRLLLDPAEGGDVRVGAEQDAGLRGAGLRREVGLPLVEPVRPIGEPARHLGRVAVAHGAAKHGEGQPVDLEVDDAGNVGRDGLTCAPGDALDDPERVGVVVVGPQHHLQGDGHGGDDEAGEERRQERVDPEGVLGEPGGEQQDGGVAEEDEQEAQGDGVREAQRGDERREQGVEQGDESRGEEGAQRPDDVDAGLQRRGRVDRDRRDDPTEDEPHGPDPHGRRLPLGPLAVRGLRLVRAHPSFSSVDAAVRAGECIPLVEAAKAR